MATEEYQYTQLHGHHKKTLKAKQSNVPDSLIKPLNFVIC